MAFTRQSLKFIFFIPTIVNGVELEFLGEGKMYFTLFKFIIDINTNMIKYQLKELKPIIKYNNENIYFHENGRK